MRVYYVKVNSVQLENFEFETYSEALELARLYRIENDVPDEVEIEVWVACVKWEGDDRYYGCEGRVSVV